MEKKPCVIQPDLGTPLPINYYTDNLKIASRTTFWQWGKEGLRITRVGGRGFLNLHNWFIEATMGIVVLITLSLYCEVRWTRKRPWNLKRKMMRKTSRLS